MFKCFVHTRFGVETEGGNPTGREAVLITARIWPGTGTTPRYRLGFPPPGD